MYCKGLLSCPAETNPAHDYLFPNRNKRGAINAQDESPFLQRKSVRAAPGGPNARRGQNSASEVSKPCGKSSSHTSICSWEGRCWLKHNLLCTLVTLERCMFIARLSLLLNFSCYPLIMYGARTNLRATSEV